MKTVVGKMVWFPQKNNCKKSLNDKNKIQMILDCPENYYEQPQILCYFLIVSLFIIIVVYDMLLLKHLVYAFNTSSYLFTRV